MVYVLLPCLKKINRYRIMGYFRVAKFSRFSLKTWGLFFADLNFRGRQRPPKINLIFSAKIKEWVTQLDFPSIDHLCGKKTSVKVSATQGNKRYLQSNRQTDKKNIFTFSRLNKMMKSKKISNDQELIQSYPTSCPQNQKGNN